MTSRSEGHTLLQGQADNPELAALAGELLRRVAEDIHGERRIEVPQERGGTLEDCEWSFVSVDSPTTLVATLAVAFPGYVRGSIRRRELMHALHGSRVTRPLLWYLCVALAAMASVPGEALGSPVPSVDARRIHSEARLADLAKIQSVLELRLVRQRLGELGLTEQEIATRLARLSDEELYEFALRLDEVAAGGSSVGFQGDGPALGYVAVVLLLLTIYGIVGIVRIAIGWVESLRDRPVPSAASP